MIKLQDYRDNFIIEIGPLEILELMQLKLIENRISNGTIQMQIQRLFNINLEKYLYTDAELKQTLKDQILYPDEIEDYLTVNINYTM